MQTPRKEWTGGLIACLKFSTMRKNTHLRVSCQEPRKRIFPFGPKGQPFTQRRAEPWCVGPPAPFIAFRPEGPAVRPAKGKALVRWSSRALPAFRPEGPAVRPAKGKALVRRPSHRLQCVSFFIFGPKGQPFHHCLFQEVRHAAVSSTNLAAHHLQHQWTPRIPAKSQRRMIGPLGRTLSKHEMVGGVGQRYQGCALRWVNGWPFGPKCNGERDP